jgi:hypothetical protein
MKVSWYVPGICQDAYAQGQRIPLAEDTPEDDRRPYLGPVKHGQTEELDLHHRRMEALDPVRDT